MKFGYFTLSDNHYENNHRSANQFVLDILVEAVHADELGMHSAWIGEHHFSTLGVLSCPDLVLSNVAARTKRIRLAPAVTVLPLHNPIRVAEQWATLDLLSGGRVDFGALNEWQTHFGWTAGAGVEVGLTPNWSAKAEYLYVRLNDRGYVLTGVNNGFQSNLFRLGVNYRF